MNSLYVILEEKDPCDPSPCKHGKCKTKETKGKKYPKCDCDDGWKGRYCNKKGNASSTYTVYLQFLQYWLYGMVALNENVHLNCFSISFLSSMCLHLCPFLFGPRKILPVYVATLCSNSHFEKTNTCGYCLRKAKLILITEQLAPILLFTWSTHFRCKPIHQSWALWYWNMCSETYPKHSCHGDIFYLLAPGFAHKWADEESENGKTTGRLYCQIIY